MKRLEILVLIPTYNERENVPLLVQEVLGIRDDIGIVIVDDNSPDGTGAVAEELARKYPDRVHVIHRKGERGRGTAGVRGFKYIITQPATFALEMDADFSHDPKYVPEFLKEIAYYDVVVGSRFVRGGKDAHRTILRRIMSLASRLVYRAILGLPLTDIGSGYKCYRMEVLRSLPWERFYSYGISISMEELFRIARKGYRVKEIPIEFYDRRSGKSKLTLSDAIEPAIVAVRLVLSLGRA